MNRYMIQFEFDNIVDQHQHWIRDYRFGTRADFTRRTLEDLDMSNLDLSGAVFNHANIFRCDITDTDLTNIVANYAHFSDSNFTRTKLKHANLRYTKFTNPTFQDTDFWGVFGDGEHIISLQLGGRDVCYTSDYLQIGCMQFDLDKVFNMSTDDFMYRLRTNTALEQQQALIWWNNWKSQIYQITEKNPAKTIK